MDDEDWNDRMKDYEKYLKCEQDDTHQWGPIVEDPILGRAQQCDKCLCWRMVELVH